VLFDALHCHGGRHRRALGTLAGSRMGSGKEPTKISVAGWRLGEQGQVLATRGLRAANADDGDLGTGDRPDPDALTGMGELHRAPDAIVVGEAEGVVAELRCLRGQLDRGRGAVEKREGGVGVQLDIRPQPRDRVAVVGQAPRPWLEAVPSRLNLEAALGRQ
jgi:hypothetical protein